MNTRQMRAIILVFTLGMSMNTYAGLFGFGGDSWKEEVLLHDGQKIIVKRTVERGGRHEIGQEPPIKEQSLSFNFPGTNEPVIWEDKFSEDVGSANFLPTLLDIRQGTAYLVVYPMGCLAYNKWGRPNPEYVVFKYENKVWMRVSLQDLPTQIKTPNLILSSPDETAKKTGQSIVSAESIKKMYEGYKQPEYKSILRESAQQAWSNCPAMVSYGKSGGWIGLDWFTDQPSLKACLSFCDRKKVSAETCPCNSIFKGK